MEGSDETLFVITKIKEYPCLYDRKDRNYNNDKVKHTILRKIASMVNQNFSSSLKMQLTAENIKAKWENYRKSFVRAHKKMLAGIQPKYYLYQHLNFLEPYILHLPTSEDSKIKEEKIFEEDINDSDEDLNCQDVERVVKKCKNQFQQDKTMKNIISSTASTSSTVQNTSTTPTVPKYDSKCNKASAEKEKLHDAVSNILNKTIKAAEALSDENDCYLLSIEEALLTVKKEELLKCINGVLKIIKRYTNKTT